MPYPDVTLRELKMTAGINSQRGLPVPEVPPMGMGDILRDDLAVVATTLVHSEKAKSERVATPILKEFLRKNGYFFTVYSGEVLTADKERRSARMLGVQTYDAQSGTLLPATWGCATTADKWIFMRLTGTGLLIHQRKCYLSEIKASLGVFRYMLDYYCLALLNRFLGLILHT